jgi:hypothetical protein
MHYARGRCTDHGRIGYLGEFIGSIAAASLPFPTHRCATTRRVSASRTATPDRHVSSVGVVARPRRMDAGVLVATRQGAPQAAIDGLVPPRQGDLCRTLVALRDTVCNEPAPDPSKRPMARCERLPIQNLAHACAAAQVGRPNCRSAQDRSARFDRNVTRGLMDRASGRISIRVDPRTSHRRARAHAGDDGGVDCRANLERPARSAR